jgi:hypothetical protein
MKRTASRCGAGQPDAPDHPFGCPLQFVIDRPHAADELEY